MKRLVRMIIHKARSALRESGPTSLERWRASLTNNLKIGPNGTIDHAVLDVRAPACRVSIGDECDIRSHIVLENEGASLVVGSRTHTGGGTTFSLASTLTIGDDVLISFGVLVMDHGGHSLQFSERSNDAVEWMHGRKDWTHVPISPITIKNKAWIGARSIILKGVTIGEGAVVGAGSVVTRSVPDWTVVAGNPARVIRELPH